MKDTEEKHYRSVNLNKAKERLQEEDRFDKKIIGRKLRHMEKPEEKPPRSKQRPKIEVCFLGLEW